MTEQPKWWDEMVWEYNNEGLTIEVLKNKEQRCNGKVLSNESYDFVVFISSYQT